MHPLLLVLHCFIHILTSTNSPVIPDQYNVWDLKLPVACVYINGLYNRIEKKEQCSLPQWLLTGRFAQGWKLVYKHETHPVYLVIRLNSPDPGYRWSIYAMACRDCSTHPRGTALTLSLIMDHKSNLIIAAHAHNATSQTRILLELARSCYSEGQSAVTSVEGRNSIMAKRIEVLESRLQVQNNQTTVSVHRHVINSVTLWMILALISSTVLCQVLIVWYCQSRDRKKYQLKQMEQMIHRNAVLRRNVSAVAMVYDTDLNNDKDHQKCEMESTVSTHSTDEGDVITITDRWDCEDFGQAVMNRKVADELLLDDIVNKMITDRDDAQLEEHKQKIPL
eukprot:408170_1